MEIKQIIQDSINIKQQIVDNEEFINNIKIVAEVCSTSLHNGGRIHFCGNGGSAADAQHLAAELSGRFTKDRKPLNAEALHTNSSYLTAVANDYGYENVYSRLLEATSYKGDVLIALSTSGNSKNVVNAIEYAKNNGIFVVGLTGISGGEMTNKCDILINVPSTNTARIQETHIMIGHIICELIENKLFQ